MKTTINDHQLMASIGNQYPLILPIILRLAQTSSCEDEFKTKLREYLNDLINQSRDVISLICN